MAYNNLSEYYAANGGMNAWNSPTRLADAKRAGIQNYEGTAAQNVQLLSFLTAPKPTQPSIASQVFTPPQVGSFSTRMQTSTPATATPPKPIVPLPQQTIGPATPSYSAPSPSPFMNTNGNPSATPVAPGASPSMPSISGLTTPTSKPLSGFSLNPSSSAPNQLVPSAPVQPPKPQMSPSQEIAQGLPIAPAGQAVNVGGKPYVPTAPASTPTTSSGAPINPATGGVVKPPAPPSQPTMPIIPPKSKTDVESALKAYTAAQQISPEEDAAQAELDRLQEGTILGLNKIRDQAIPMDFITGQSASLERRGLALQVPLEQKLARMQAKRQAAIEGSKFALERADKAATEEKPIEVNGQLVQRDPTTGEYKTVFGTPKSSEGFTLGEGQTRYDAAGNPIAGPGTGGGAGTTGNPAVDSWVKLINDGRAKLSDVPNTILNQVAAGLGQAPAGTDPKAQYALNQANTAITGIDTALALLQNPNSMNLSETAFGRAVGGVIPGGSVANLDAALETVKALVGFDALQKMRESSPTGGALGNITERELAFLQSVQGSLNTMQGTEQLIATINRIKQSFETLKIISSPDGTEFQLDGQTYVKQGDQFVPKSFNQVGGDTQQASRPVRNNNPLNIKASAATSTYSGVAGLDPSPATDGGQFLVFQSPEAGFQAAKRLIQTEGYRGLTVDAALRRWSNNGYGGEVAPSLQGKTIGQLTSTELDALIQAMARKEGYYA